jgi:hypothetical protein
LTVLGGDYKTSQRNDRTKQIRDSWRVLWDAHALDCDVVNERVVDHLPQQVTVYGTCGRHHACGRAEATHTHRVIVPAIVCVAHAFACLYGAGEEWSLKRKAPVNERWRFNKYDVGQKFGPHFDAGFMRNVNEVRAGACVVMVTTLQHRD